GAILLANVFFWGHGPAVIHDSRGYYELSKVIRQSGLFWCADDLQIINSDYAILFKLRTYGYPLVVALCSLFTSQDLVTVQITVFNCQLLLCLATCYYCATVLQGIFKFRGFGTWLYVCS